MSEEGAPTRPRASVYVDGLNLYRRLLQGFPEHKWLDVVALMAALLPEYDVVRVRYFTAIIKVMPGADVSSPQRQQAYLRALAASSKVSIHLGKFRIDKRVMPLHPTVFEADGSPRRVVVKKAEEKGSDVALASYLMLDAMRGEEDLYALCSNDSDLVTPLKLVGSELGRAVGLISPVSEKRASNELKQTAPALHRQITPHLLGDCQLPEEVMDAVGTVRRPPKWAKTSRSPAEARLPNQ
ncbi:MAG: NYN domain-containing protein [Pseudonocardiaceae bacterium]